MNRQDAICYIYEHFEHACLSLFEGLNCEVSFASENDEALGNAFIAMIDAGSEELEVQLFVRMPFSVLALTYPGENVTDIEEEKLEDWMAELSNMLIGKIKASLLTHNVEIKIGLPESFFGVQFDDITPTGYDHKIYYFLVDNVPVECRMYLDLLVDELEVNLDAAEEDNNEGELELF